MPKKSDEYRFTLRFNPENEMHVAAARILNSKGHGISEFVAQAVMAYVASLRAGGQAIACLSTVSAQKPQIDLADKIKAVVNAALNERETAHKRQKLTSQVQAQKTAVEKLQNFTPVDGHFSEPDNM